jgi:hypothetical protein
MTNYASLRGPVGMNRAYAKIDGPPDEGRFLEAVKAGRTFATNGPLVELTVGGKEVGSEIALPAGRHRLQARVRLRSLVAVDHLQIVGQAGIVAEIPLSGDRKSADAEVPLRVDRSGWYTLRAFADEARHPVLDHYPFATTSPVYVTVGGAPVRSPADARYFVAWMDRVIEEAEGLKEWNTPEEKREVLEHLRLARGIYLERSRP